MKIHDSSYYSKISRKRKSEDSSRHLRVESLLRQNIFQFLSRAGFINDFQVSTTRTEVSKDLRHLKVFWRTLLKDDLIEEIDINLADISYKLSGYLFKTLDLKYPMKITFVYDDQYEQLIAIDKFLATDNDDSSAF